MNSTCDIVFESVEPAYQDLQDSVCSSCPQLETEDEEGEGYSAVECEECEG